jgi:hypothetical protein
MGYVARVELAGDRRLFLSVAGYPRASPEISCTVCGAPSADRVGAVTIYRCRASLMRSTILLPLCSGACGRAAIIAARDRAAARR